MKQALEVDVEHLGELFGRQIQHGLAPIDAGNVDRHVHTTRKSSRVHGRSSHALPIPNVGPYGRALAAEARDHLRRPPRPFEAMSRQATSAPNCAKPRAIARPRPEAAPVTTAHLPSSRKTSDISSGSPLALENSCAIYSPSR